MRETVAVFGHLGPTPAIADAPIGGPLFAVAALSAHACAALVGATPQTPARVLQAAGDATTVTSTRLPASFQASALFRSQDHILVVGTRRTAHDRRAAIAVVAVVR